MTSCPRPLLAFNFHRISREKDRDINPFCQLHAIPEKDFRLFVKLLSRSRA
jgi:hypothetical protein